MRNGNEKNANAEAAIPSKNFEWGPWCISSHVFMQLTWAACPQLRIKADSELVTAANKGSDGDSADRNVSKLPLIGSKLMDTSRPSGSL